MPTHTTPSTPPTYSVNTELFCGCSSRVTFALLRWAFFSFRCSSPSVTSTTMRPARLRPVRPMRCTMRVGDPTASKDTMRSTSPTSSPSSPMQVATSVLSSPARKSFTTACCSFCVCPFSAPTVFDVAWPTNDVAMTSGCSSRSSSTISPTLSRYCVNTMARVLRPAVFARWKWSESSSTSFCSFGWRALRDRTHAHVSGWF